MKYLFLIMALILSTNAYSYQISQDFFVYETVLLKLSNSKTSSKIVFFNETSPLYIKGLTLKEFYELYGKQFPTLPKESVQDLLKKNKKQINVGWKSIMTDVTFVSEKLKNSKKNFDHYVFNEIGANFYVTMSQVGFNKDGTHAVLAFSQHCGALCGSGGIIHLVKTNDKYWTLENGVIIVRE